MYFFIIFADQNWYELKNIIFNLLKWILIWNEIGSYKWQAIYQKNFDFWLFELQENHKRIRKKYSTKRQQTIGRFCLTFKFPTTLDFWKRERHKYAVPWHWFPMFSTVFLKWNTNWTCFLIEWKRNEQQWWRAAKGWQKQQWQINQKGKNFDLFSKWREGSNPKTLSWLFY